MDKAVAPDLGAATAGVVNVVVLHCDEVGGAGKVDSPVVAAIAGRGPAGLAVKFIVGQSDAVGGAVASDEHLATNQGELAVI